MTPNQLLAACHAGDGGEWDIPFSLRFRSASLASLSRTPSVAGNRKTWTWSGWVKRGSLGSYQSLFSTYLGSSTGFAAIRFGLDNTLSIFDYTGAALVWNLQTTQVFRDPSAWYHIQVAVDTTQPIASERVRLSVNGSRVSAFAAATYPTLNANTYTNNTTASAVGASNPGTASQYFDGYLAEVHFVDGQALDTSYFGKISQESGQWTPIRYRGSYGTNGFYLDFKDASGITALGYDQSGQSNHWTPNNFSLTTGVYYDHMADSPTNNFPVINGLTPLSAAGASSYRSGGNLTWTNTNANLSDQQVSSIVDFSLNQGYYIEAAVGAIGAGGIYTGLGTYSNSYYRPNGQLLLDGVVVATVATYTTGDVLGLAVNPTTITFYKNGTVVYTATKTSTDFGILINGYSGIIWHVNFGQHPFKYPIPEGFKTLCSKNLPVPAIKRGEMGMDIVTYTGNGGNQQIGEYQFPRFDYLIPKSLRFKGVNSALARTPAAVGNRQKWTWSGWVKKADIDTLGVIFGSGQASNADDNIQIGSDNKIYFVLNNTGTQFTLKSDRKIINPNEWNHINVALDTTLLTDTHRVKLYLNGELLSLTGTYPNQNFSCYGINYTRQQTFGMWYTGAYPFDGYMAEIYFIDGQALDPTAFGEQDINGYWIPKAYAGTYGANGFYLDFADTSAVANLGYDKSGLGNNFAVTNVSLTAGVTYDSMDDSPTNNFAVLDALTADIASSSITNAGLAIVSTNADLGAVFSSLEFPATGKWYCEFTVGSSTSKPQIGVLSPTISYHYNSFDGTMYAGSTLIGTASVAVTNDVIGIYVNWDIGRITIHKNNVGIYQADVDAFKGRFRVLDASVTSAIAGHINFGQRPFTYAPPEGFKTLSIPNIAEYNQDLESPDLVWIKCRNAAQNHMLFDSIRGPGKYLSSNLTAAEATDVNSLVSFNKNGFYLGNNANVNTLNNTYIAWMWKASQNQVTNNDGSITSQVRANPALGFSVVEYTGTGVVATVGHGLGVRPDVILLKNIGSAYNWHVYHKDADANPATGVMVLNLTQAFASYSPAWNDTLPTSSVLSLGNGIGVNESAKDHIAYCFSEVEGLSKFGLYVGNGSTDGPFVYCGFKPRWIMYKARGEVGGWAIYDTERDADNIVTGAIVTQATSAELISSYIDILSNGFKLRNASTSHNTSGIGYIFMAFAECPFKYSTAQ